MVGFSVVVVGEIDSFFVIMWWFISCGCGCCWWFLKASLCFFFLYGGSFLWLWLVGGLSCGFAYIGDGFGV